MFIFEYLARRPSAISSKSWVEPKFTKTGTKREPILLSLPLALATVLPHKIKNDHLHRSAVLGKPDTRPCSTISLRPGQALAWRKPGVDDFEFIFERRQAAKRLEADSGILDLLHLIQTVQMTFQRRPQKMWA
jgi:hypothetical protein